MKGDDARLDQLDKNEMWDVARVFRPELTWDELCVMWDEFQALKRSHELQ